MSGRIALKIGAPQFAPASERDREAGLIGFVSFEVAEVRIDGVAVRRTLAGRLELSYPERERRSGRRFPIVYPRTPEARRAIEAAVLEAIRPDLARLGIAFDPARPEESRP